MRSMVDESHLFLKPALHRRAVCVDATLGHGKDTAFFLSEGVQKVFAFEIQENILQNTMKKLEDPKVQAFCQGHETMDTLIFEPIDAMIFNFGYCPQEDPSICTQADTSVMAIQKGLKLLKRKGRMALVLYPHPSGKEEARCIEKYVQSLSASLYTVVQYKQLNKEDSPYLIGIEKKEGYHE